MTFSDLPTRARWAIVLLLLACVAALLPGLVDRAAGVRPALSASDRETTLLGSGPQWGRLLRAHRRWELGLRFHSDQAGRVVALRHFRSARDQSTHVGSLWSPDGELLARADFGAGTGRGWQRATLSAPVRLEPGEDYTVSYTVDEGSWFVVRPGQFEDGPLERGPLTGTTGVWGGSGSLPTQDGPQSNYLVDVAFVADGVEEPTAGATSAPTGGPSDSASPTVEPATTAPAPTSPAPTSATSAPTATPSTPSSSSVPTTTPTTAPTSPTSSVDFPDADDTGVPAGTTLTRYDGPCTITRTVTLEAVDATACDALLIRAPGVVITDSLLPRIDLTEGGTDSATIEDSTIDGGTWSDGAVWGSHVSLLRVEIVGGKDSVHCADDCTVVDSWLHDQYNPDGESYHNQAFLTNGGSGMVLRGNTLHCTPTLNADDGGCTADVSLFGDFDPVSDVLVEGNYLRANDSSISYCAYGGYQPTKRFPVATAIRYVDNVFERGTNRKCGVYGPVTSFDPSAAGNVWSGNRWSDGGVVPPG